MFFVCLHIVRSTYRKARYIVQANSACCLKDSATGGRRRIRPSALRAARPRGAESVLADWADRRRQTPLAALEIPGRLVHMSAVELAVEKVKKLSASQARELLGWLDARQANGTAAKGRSRPWWRKGTPRERMKQLRAWQDSVRLTTDWEPPRMPDDLVEPFRL